MADYNVYLPKVKDPDGTVRETSVYWYVFHLKGRRYRGSTGQTKITLARDTAKNERAKAERALAGLPVEPSEQRIRTVSMAIKEYLKTYRANHQPRAVELVEDRSKALVKHMGTRLLADMTAPNVAEYVTKRKTEGMGPRTINIEVGILARAIGQTWRYLWPKLKPLTEPHDVGRALSPEEEVRILGEADKSTSPFTGLFIRMALMTGMRFDEIRTLRWGQIDLAERTIQVGRAKTEAGTGRLIPINADLWAVLDTYRAAYSQRYGSLDPAFYVFPWGAERRRVSARVKKPLEPQRVADPMRPVTHIKTAWDSIREDAGVSCRFHDLRHTFATKLAEAGVPESAMLSLMGHMSRKMLERYSHIRMTAKREAVEAVRLAVVLEPTAKQDAKQAGFEAEKSGNRRTQLVTVQ